MEIVLAYTHILGILIVFISLYSETLLLQSTMSQRDVKKLAKADSWYGLGAIIMLVTGFSRIYLVGKVSDYYWGHDLFLIKLGLFTIVGLLSIYPTVQFIKLNKRVRAENLEEVQVEKAVQFKKLIWLQLGILLCIPLLANMVARGIGY
jgi:putative membrane protein